MSPFGGMLLIERREDVLTVTLNRPEVHNALHPDQLAGLRDLVGEAGRDSDLKLIVLTGAGGRAFSAGFDIKALNDAPPGSPPPSEVLFEVTGALLATPVPTLAAIEGHCIGAGLDLAMSCDHRIAAPGATFSLPAAKIGTVYQPRSLARFNSVVGASVTKRLAVCGHRLDAEEALRVGLVDRVVPAAAIADAADGWIAGDASIARAHKLIVDRISAPPERSDGFWEPLVALRQRSLASKERSRALREFAEPNNDSGDGK